MFPVVNLREEKPPMVEMGLTEVLAWALIAAGTTYWAFLSKGLPAAAVTATLAALATKSLLLDLI
jgi:hypothetical protein